MRTLPLTRNQGIRTDVRVCFSHGPRISYAGSLPRGRWPARATSQRWTTFQLMFAGALSLPTTSPGSHSPRNSAAEFAAYPAPSGLAPGGGKEGANTNSGCGKQMFSGERHHVAISQTGSTQRPRAHQSPVLRGGFWFVGVGKCVTPAASASCVKLATLLTPSFFIIVLR